MIGTLLNVAGILVGGVIGLARRGPVSPARESFFRVVLGVFAVFYGLRLTWLSLNGSAGQITKEVIIAIVAMMLGRVTGRFLCLQTLSNHLGQVARTAIAEARPGDPARVGAGFKTAAALYCAAPLGILGSLQDGLTHYAYPLGVKALMDGLATMGFVPVFGWGVMLAALPVLAVQGTITLLSAHLLEPFLRAHSLLDSVNAVGGLLVFSVALVILGIKKLALTDYLPSLIFAPLITWLWH
jgi:uncharacterized membrane protein YqgA involved in biofilm formation